MLNTSFLVILTENTLYIGHTLTKSEYFILLALLSVYEKHTKTMFKPVSMYAILDLLIYTTHILEDLQTSKVCQSVAKYKQYHDIRSDYADICSVKQIGKVDILYTDGMTCMYL